MAVQLAVYAYPKGFAPSLRRYEITGKVNIGAGNYPANGLPVSWLMTEIDGVTPYIQPRSKLPVTAFFYSISGTNNEYLYDTLNQTMRILTARAELATGAAITAGVLADVVEFQAQFLKDDF